jgi:hypothetical protein
MMREKFYLVERYGVYQQGIVGIFETYDQAKDALFLAQSEEPDDYHGFRIRSVLLGHRYSDLCDDSELLFTLTPSNGMKVKEFKDETQ